MFLKGDNIVVEQVVAVEHTPAHLEQGTVERGEVARGVSRADGDCETMIFDGDHAASVADPGDI
jgi:hypothetical protein